MVKRGIDGSDLGPATMAQDGVRGEASDESRSD
jgi:hypothetical protein